jgi:two-component system, cell cycle sensor histidine kinase and response regulator CckA
MNSTATDAIETKRMSTLDAFAALANSSDSDTLINAAVEIVLQTVDIDCCRIYRRGENETAVTLAACAGTAGPDTDAALQRLASHALEHYHDRHTQPARAGEALAVVIEGNSAPFGVCIAHRNSADPFSCTETEFVRSVAGLLTGAFIRAHAARDNARFRALVSSSSEAIIEATKDGRIFNWNAAAETVFGYPRADIVGQCVTVLVAAHHPEAFGVLDEMCRGRGQGPHKMTCQRCDGSNIDVVVRAEPIVLPDGRVTAATLTVRDAREQDERQALKGQLQHAQRLEVVGRLASGVAHDFNNTLTVVAGYSELLRVKLDGHPSAASDLEEIERAVESARHLIRQLLAFSRNQPMRPALMDLAATARSARGMLTRLIGEDIELSVVGDEPVKVLADAGQIDQVLLNLAVNARDAMPAGGKLVVETSVAQWNDGAFGLLKVSDTGLGMDQETVRHIFEPFFTTKASGRGVGLGLATVHGIVKQSGGDITVESQPGRGTTFHIYLPLAAKKIIAFKGKATRRKPLPLAGETTISGTVLVVEDDHAVRSVLRNLLTSAGLIVLDAANPEEALDLITAYRGTVDVLLSDVVMPRQSGPELASSLMIRFPHLQVVYMSGYTRDEVGHRHVPADAPFLRKPFSAHELNDFMRKALRGRAGSGISLQ